VGLPIFGEKTILNLTGEDKFIILALAVEGIKLITFHYGFRWRWNEAT